MKTFGDIEVGDKLFYISLGHGSTTNLNVLDIKNEDNGKIITCEYGNKIHITSQRILNCSYIKMTHDVVTSDPRLIEIKEKMEKYKRRNT